jgi:hypothetical protein
MFGKQSRTRPMESPEGNRIEVPLAQRVGTGATAAQIAEALTAIWQDIDSALAPIIGSKGVVALYKRSLHLTAESYPWLAGTHEDSGPSFETTALRRIVVQQSSADAALGGNALLQTFHQLLGTLIGLSLTERLLSPVWSDSSSGPPAQDTKP